jgi:hypothetical protein
MKRNFSLVILFLVRQILVIFIYGSLKDDELRYSSIVGVLIQLIQKIYFMLTDKSIFVIKSKKNKW